MSVDEIVTAVVLLMSAVGYVFLLARFLLPMILATGAFAALVAQDYPMDQAHMPVWVGGVLGFLLALVASRFILPRPTTANPPSKKTTKDSGKDVVVDGTNVMYWPGDADLDALRSVVDYLRGKDFMPYVFLDASSRHHLKDRSLDEKGFARALALPRNRVMVCPAGTEADAFILQFAREQALPIVSNDRFSDRAGQVKGIKLIKGVFARGRPILHGL